MPVVFVVSSHPRRVVVLSASAANSFQVHLLGFDTKYLGEPVAQTIELTGLAQNVEAAKKQLKTGQLVLTGRALSTGSVVVQLEPKKVKKKMPAAMLFCARLTQPDKSPSLDCISGQRQSGPRVEMVRMGWLAGRQGASLRYRLSLAGTGSLSLIHDFDDDPGLAQTLRWLSRSRGHLPVVEGWNDATQSWDMWGEKRMKGVEKTILHTSLGIRM